MKTGIIGAGNIGSALAKHFHDLGHTVRIANSRGPATLSKVVEKTGAIPVDVSEAAKGVDLLVIAISEKNILSLPENLTEDLPSGSPIIDTGNYIPLRDGKIIELEEGLSESEWVASVLRRPIIKAFNNIIATSLIHGGRAKGSKERIALPVAGDDLKAKHFVIDLLDDMGFDGIDAGLLSESWRQQPGTPAYTTNYNADQLRTALANARRAIAPRMRDVTARIALGLPPSTRLADMTIEKIRNLPPPPSAEEQVRLIRGLWADFHAN